MNDVAQWLVAGGAGAVFVVRLVLNASNKPTKPSTEPVPEHDEAGEPAREGRS